MQSWFERHFVFSALCIFVVLAIVFTFPAVLHLSDALIGVGGDTYQYLGFQSLVKLRILQGEWPFGFTTLLRYPAGLNFRVASDALLTNTVGGLLSLLLNSSALSYNLVILGGLVANMAASAWYFTTLTKSKVAGLLGGVSFGASFYVLGRAAGHINLLLVAGFPLLALALLRIGNALIHHKTIRWTDILLFVAAWLILVVSSAQYVVLAAIGCLLIAFGLLVWYPELLQRMFSGARLQLTRILLLFVLTGLPSLLLLLPIVQAVFTGDVTYHAGNYSPLPLNFVWPNPFLPTVGSSLGVLPKESAHIEHIVFAGWIEIALFFASVIYWLRRPQRKLGLFFLGTSLVLFIFTLGTRTHIGNFLLPYGFISWLYPFAAIAEPGRYSIILNLLLTSSALLFLERVTKAFSPQRKQLLLGVVACVIVLERLSLGGFYQTLILPKTSAHTVAAALPGKAVFDIPAFDERQNAHPDLYEGKSVINGYPHWLADTENSRAYLATHPILSRFMCDGDSSTFDAQRLFENSEYRATQGNDQQQLLEQLRDDGITTIVVHKDYKIFWPGCSNVLAQRTMLFPPVMRAESTGLRNQELHTRWAAGPHHEIGLFFPYAGTFRIRSINVSPWADAQTVKLFVSGQEQSNTDWAFTQSPENYSTWLSPIDKQTKWQVTAGDKFLLQPLNYQETGFITIDYEYVLQNQSDKAIPQRYKLLEKIYEDSAKEVYFIHDKEF